jgi:Spy/CpxP family protein refolding chaperone
MHHLKYLTLALLLAPLATTPTYAKPSQYGKTCETRKHQATRPEHLKTRLDLTAQQETEIKEILAARKERNEALRELTRTSRKEIREIFRADSLDESRLRELICKQSYQRADMMITPHATRTRIKKVLSTEQEEQHEAFRQQKQERRGSAKYPQPKQEDKSKKLSL